MFEGMYSAIVTPFKRDTHGESIVDYESLEKLIEWQIQEGVDGLVVVGSTGEAATLSHQEKLSVLKRSVEIVRKRVPIIAGTGSNCTRSTLELTREVRSLGVEGALLVSPYYNKPSQEGLYEHFKLVAEKGGLPVVVYNIPGRSVVEINTDTFRKLSAVPGIVAVKQAVDSISKLHELSDALNGKVTILAGDDPITYAVFTVGGKGVISASGSVIPKEMLAITRAGLSGNMQEAFAAQQRALPAIRALFLETNPIPAKAALKMLGQIQSDEPRLPLLPATEKTKSALRATLVGCNN